jgi:hypothetical protein
MPTCNPTEPKFLSNVSGLLTAKYHISNILIKLGVDNNRVVAITTAMFNRIVQSHDDWTIVRKGSRDRDNFVCRVGSGYLLEGCLP